jgi:hypothetical protein
MAKLMAEQTLHRPEHRGFKPGEVDLPHCGKLCGDTAMAAAMAHCRDVSFGSKINQVTKWQATATTFDGTDVERAAKLFDACRVSVQVAHGQVSVDHFMYEPMNDSDLQYMPREARHHDAELNRDLRDTSP